MKHRQHPLLLFVSTLAAAAGSLGIGAPAWAANDDIRLIESLSETFDLIDDTAPTADIVSANTSIDAQGRVIAEITAAEYDPSAIGRFHFDVNRDGKVDYVATADAVTDADGAVRCNPTVVSDASIRLEFTARCIGNPAEAMWSADLTNVEGSDRIPDLGMAGPVVNDAYDFGDAAADVETVAATNLFAGRIAGGATVEIVVAGRAGVPTDAAAAMLNIGVADSRAAGHITAYPCGVDLPVASNLNYLAGAIVSNSSLTSIGANGAICVHSHATTDLSIDVSGYTPNGSAVTPVAPERHVDTRVSGRRLGAGDIAHFQIAGAGSVSAGTRTVVLNLTAVAPEDAGHLTVFPCDTPQPVASNINYTAGNTVANLVTAQLAADGTLCVAAHTAVDVIIDVNAFRSTAELARAPLVANAPRRALDTRDASGVRYAGSVTRLPLAGVAGVPTVAGAVLINVTAVNPLADGSLTVFDCDVGQPPASTVDYQAGSVVANGIVVQLSGSGEICVATSAEAHIVIDVNGFVMH